MDNDVGPLLASVQTTSANFTNGTLNERSSQKIKYGCFEYEQEYALPEKKRKKLLVAETKDMRYVGQNFGSLAPTAKGLSNYMVGVLNKETGKMRLYDTEVFNMKPESLDNEDEVDKPEMSFMQKNDELTAAFGSSKKKRAMASRHKNMLKEGALQDVVGSAVDKTLQSPFAEKLLTPVEHQNNASEIPAYDATGAKPEDVYKLNSIINEDEMELLHGPAQVFVGSDKKIIDEWSKEEKYPSYVISHLRKMPIKEESRLHRAKCLTYLHMMILLFKCKAQDFRRKDPFPMGNGIPDNMKKQLLKKFTLQPEGTTKRFMTARCKDRLVSYILVLCLILDEFNLDYTELLKDLKMSLVRMNTFFRALGCKVTTKRQVTPSGTTQNTLVTLPIPLTFPEIKVKKQGNKGR